MMAQVCEGLTVLDISRGIAGAIGTMILADSGAEVIKVEPPGGDWLRDHPAFVVWNRGKKSVVLDLKSSAGREKLLSMIPAADVLVAAGSTEANQRLGLSYAALQHLNKGLIVCSITGFGPLKTCGYLKGYEGIVSAKTGRCHRFDKQVAKDGPRYAAVHCASFGAAMHAVQGIMAALYMRSRTDRGQHVETSLLQALCAYDLFSLKPQLPPGNWVPPAGSPSLMYFVSPTKDGYWLQMANGMSHQLINFITAVGVSDVLDQPRFNSFPYLSDDDREHLYRILYTKIQEKTLDEWMEVFVKQYDVAAEPFRTSVQALDHPQMVHNRNIIEIQDPTLGRTRQPGPLVVFSDTPMVPHGPAPALGAHTQEILGSLPNRRLQLAGDGRNQKHPLDGVMVLEFASWFAAPFGTAILADMGARVIHVEPLEGDTTRDWGPVLSKQFQGKESLAVDLKKPEGQCIVHALVKKTDIVIHNYRPGVPERLGIPYHVLREINPRLLYLYAGGYGSTGPYAHRACFHPIPGAICGGASYQAGSGMLPPPGTSLTGSQIRQTSSMLFQANEGNPDVTSALVVATALLMALFAREKTGRGQFLETTMICSNLYANSDDAFWYEGKPDRLLPDAHLNGLHALYRSYRASEGWIFLACPRQDEWERFCRVVGRLNLWQDPRFATRRLRLEHDEELGQAIEEVIAKQTAKEWESLLSANDLGCAEVREGDFSDFANTEESMRAAGQWVKTQHPSIGHYWRYGPAITFSEAEPRLGPTNYAGEHSNAILKELGYDASEIEDLRRGKVVNWPTEDRQVTQ